MMNISYSIIIPTYNAEEYLETCLQSILIQTYKNYEIIIIDDGSTDRTSEISDCYERKYSNITVIHKKNGGIGSALATGIPIAKNDYIIFVDSDDTIKEDMLVILSKAINELQKKIDIVQFGLEFIDPKGYVDRIEVPENYILEGKENVLKDHFQRFTTPSLACRCFSRELFKSIEYIPQNVGIDELLIVQLLANADTLLSIANILYSVLLRQDSVSRISYSKDKIREYINVYEKMIVLSEKKELCIINYIYIKWMKLLIELLEKVPKNILKELSIYEIYKKSYKIVYSCSEYKKEKIIFRIKNYFLYIYIKFYLAIYNAGSNLK